MNTKPNRPAVGASRRPSVLATRKQQPLATTNGAKGRSERIEVRKTYKLYIGGEFPRTESGRAYEILGARGELLANASRGRARTSATRYAPPGPSRPNGLRRRRTTAARSCTASPS